MDINMNYAEIGKLHKMMLELNIPHTYDRLFDGWQICYPNKDDAIADVVQHCINYGAAENLLEIMGLLTKEEGDMYSVLGYLTAEDCLKRFKEHYERLVC